MKDPGAERELRGLKHPGRPLEVGSEALSRTHKDWRAVRCVRRRLKAWGR